MYEGGMERGKDDGGGGSGIPSARADSPPAHSPNRTHRGEDGGVGDDGIYRFIINRKMMRKPTLQQGENYYWKKRRKREGEKIFF